MKRVDIAGSRRLTFFLDGSRTLNLCLGRLGLKARSLSSSTFWVRGGFIVEVSREAYDRFRRGSLLGLFASLIAVGVWILVLVDLVGLKFFSTVLFVLLFVYVILDLSMIVVYAREIYREKIGSIGPGHF
jgi:hypothetical protein